MTRGEKIRTAEIAYQHALAELEKATPGKLDELRKLYAKAVNARKEYEALRQEHKSQ